MDKNDTGVLCIRLLREAEGRGQQLVLAARDRKAKRIKQARLEAEIEINEFKQCEAKLKKKQELLEQENEQRGAEITGDARIELERINNRVKACSHIVGNLLENLVCYIQPDVHHNFHIRKQIEDLDDYTKLPLRIDPVVEQMTKACISKCDLIVDNIVSVQMNNRFEA